MQRAYVPEQNIGILTGMGMFIVEADVFDNRAAQSSLTPQSGNARRSPASAKTIPFLKIDGDEYWVGKHTVKLDAVGLSCRGSQPRWLQSGRAT